MIHPDIILAIPMLSRLQSNLEDFAIFQLLKCRVNLWNMQGKGTSGVFMSSKLVGGGRKGWLFYGSDSSSVCTNQEDPQDALELVKHAEVPAAPQRY